MASINTVVDDFSSGIGSTWATWNSSTPASVVAQNGGVNISHAASGNDYNYLCTQTTYDLTSSAAYVQVLDFGNQSYASHDVMLQCYVDGPNQLWLNANNGYLVAYKKVAGTTTSLGSAIPLDTTAHRWFRIRESGGTVYFDTSPDGITWTNRFSTANPFAVTSLGFQFGTGCWQTEASGSSAIFDNFNYTPAVYSYQQTRVPNPHVGPMALRQRAFRYPLSQTRVVNAKISTFTDAFSFASLGTQWATGGNATTANGLLTLAVNNTFGGRINSVAAYDMVGGSVQVQMVQPPNVGNGGTVAMFQVTNSTNTLQNPDMSHGFIWANGILKASSETSGADPILWSAPYDSVNHEFLRLRESGGLLYYEVSPDASIWTTVASTSPIFSLSSAYVSLLAGYTGTEPSPGTAVFDNLNLQPSWNTPWLKFPPGQGPMSQRVKKRPPLRDFTRVVESRQGDPDAPRQAPVIAPNPNVGPMAQRQALRSRQRPRPTWPQNDWSGPSNDTTVGVGLTAAGVVNGVSYGSTGAGDQTYTGTRNLSWTHNIVGDYLLVFINYYWGNVGWSGTMTVNGVTVPQLASGYTLYNAGINYQGFAVYGLANPPTGTQTVTYTVSPVNGYPYMTGNSVSYSNVGGLTGTPSLYNTGTGTVNLASGTTSSEVHQMVVNGMASLGTVSISNYSGTQRSNQGYTASTGYPLVIGDAPGAPSVGFTAYESDAPIWGSISVGLYAKNDAEIIETVGLTADGVAGPGTPVTVGLTADGSVASAGGVSGDASSAITAGLTATGTPTSVSSTSASVGLIAAGVVGVAGSASTTETATITAVGVGTGTAATSESTGLTASGSVATFGSASTTVSATLSGGGTGLGSASITGTAGVTGTGVVGRLGAASSTVTAGLTAAGSVGLYGSSTTTAIALTLNAANTGTGGASSTVSAGLTATGVVGLAKTSTTTAATATLTAAGGGAGSASTAASAGLTATGNPLGSASTTVTAGLTAAGSTSGGVVTGSASSTVTAGLTASGSVGVVGSASTTATVGLTSTGVVGKSSGATTSVGPSLTAAGIVGVAGSASTVIAITPAAAGTTSSAGSASTAVGVGLTATGGAVGSASRVVSISLTATATGGQSADSSTSANVSLTASGVVGVVGDATTVVAIGIGAGGVESEYGSSGLAAVIDLSADGSVGLSQGSVATAAAVGLTAAGVVDLQPIQTDFRTLLVKAQDRLFLIRPQDRLYVVRAQDRSYLVRRT